MTDLLRNVFTLAAANRHTIIIQTVVDLLESEIKRDAKVDAVVKQGFRRALLLAAFNGDEQVLRKIVET